MNSIPSVTISAKSLEALSLKIKNFGIILGYEEGKLQEEDPATGYYELTVRGPDAESFRNNFYNLRMMFPN